jgi:hypothetical protein
VIIFVAEISDIGRRITFKSPEIYEFLDAMQNREKGLSASSCPSVRLSILLSFRTEQLDWKDFGEI